LSLKVVLAGDPAVGKSSILRRTTNNPFAMDEESTVTAQFGYR
jgi:GTPase SAR1 family protein